MRQAYDKAVKQKTIFGFRNFIKEYEHEQRASYYVNQAKKELKKLEGASVPATSNTSVQEQCSMMVHAVAIGVLDKKCDASVNANRIGTAMGNALVVCQATYPGYDFRKDFKIGQDRGTSYPCVSKKRDNLEKAFELAEKAYAMMGLKSSEAKAESFTAIITCKNKWNDLVPVLICVEFLEITKSGRLKKYDRRNTNELSKMFVRGGEEIHIDLPNSFRLKTINIDYRNQRVLGVKIINNNGKVIFEEKAGYGRVIEVTN